MAIGRVNFVEIDSRSLHFGISAKGQLAQAFQFHDVHFGAEMFRQMAVNAEGDHAVGTFKRPRILRAGRPESQIHVDFIEMSHGSLVLLQVAFGAERNGAGFTPKRPLKVMDVDVQSQLRRFREDFVANATRRFAVVRQFVGRHRCRNGRRSGRQRDHKFRAALVRPGLSREQSDDGILHDDGGRHQFDLVTFH